MSQRKEQNKTPEKEPNKMETSNLPEAEFQTLVIRLLSELRESVVGLSENFNSMKKDVESIKRDMETIKQNQSMVAHGQGLAPIEEPGAPPMLYAEAPSGVSGPSLAQLGALALIGKQLVSNRLLAWSGVLDWKVPTSSGDTKIRVMQSLPCQAYVNPSENLKTEQWPQKLSMHLIPQRLLITLAPLIRKSRMVQFLVTNRNLESAKQVCRFLDRGYMGCVHLRNQAPGEPRLLLFLYLSRKKAFLGLLPKDQKGMVIGIQRIIYSYRQNKQQRL